MLLAHISLASFLRDIGCIHVSLASYLWDIAKQKSPRWEAAKYAASHQDILFAFSWKNKKMEYIP